MIVTTQDELEKICKDIDSCGRFAIDLEFIPERTYSPVLCLAQVATDRSAHIIDPQEVEDLNELWQRVADPNILVVIHAASQDLELINNLSGLIPQNIFDTQIAAGFAGLGYSVGYGKLLNQLLGVSISKTESFTDWCNRPLTESQIEYAIDDVRHLLPMYDKLTEKLKRIGRLSWAEEECYKYSDEESYAVETGREFLRVKGATGLNRRGLAVLQALCEWRNETGKRLNRPPRALMADNLLLELSRRPPKTVDEIGRIRGVRTDQVKGFGTRIMQAIERGLTVPETECPSWPQSRIPAKKDVLLADVLFAVLKVIAYEEDLATELIVTRDELQSLVRQHRENKLKNSENPLLHGWRYELAGRRILELLNGSSLEIHFTSDIDAPILLNFNANTAGELVE